MIIPFLMTAGVVAAILHHREEQKTMAGAILSVQRRFAPSHLMSDGQAGRVYGTITMSQNGPPLTSDQRSPYFGST